MFGPLDDPYLHWLSAKVHYVDVPTPSLTYHKLLYKLYTTEFAWTLSGDDNRAQDGKELRTQFLMECDILDEPEWRAMPCSILEMLIAFSFRAAFNTGEPRHIWFWEMLENLGIKVPDADFSENRVDEALHVLVWRLYDKKGRGGLFPVNRIQRDQRRVEIWYQFCDYLLDQDRLP